MEEVDGNIKDFIEGYYVGENVEKGKEIERLVLAGKRKVAREDVDKSKVVKVVLADGRKLLLPAIKMRTLNPVEIDNFEWQYRVRSSSPHTEFLPEYSVVRGHMPFNRNFVINILDRGFLFSSCDKVNMVLRPIPANQIDRFVPRRPSWDNGDRPKGTYYTCETSVDLKKFFDSLSCSFGDVVDFWLTEGYRKDNRLMDAFKSCVIPLIPNKLQRSLLQALNAHSIIFTNSQTSKSYTLNEIIEEKAASADLSIAGLFGAWRNNEVQTGSLAGNGYFVISELDKLYKYQYAEGLFTDLLDYMESGSVERHLGKRIRCDGTKALFFVSNPKQDDILTSFYKMLKCLQGDKEDVSDTFRMGRRISNFMYCDNAVTVPKNLNASALRLPIREVIHSFLQNFYSAKIEKFIINQQRWIQSSTSDEEKVFDEKSLSCPNKSVKMFIQGLGKNMCGVRMNAIKIFMLENLDKLFNDFNNAVKAFNDEKESIYMRLVSNTLSSVDNLIVGDTTTDVEKSDSAKMVSEILNRFPNMSSADIAFHLGISERHVRRLRGD